MNPIYLTILIAFSMVGMARFTLNAQALENTCFNQSMVDSGRVGYLNEQSDSLFDAGNTELAMQRAVAALEIAKQNNDSKGEAIALVNIGNVWAKKGKYHKALAHFARSIKLKRNLNDHYKLANLYHNMAATFTNLKMYPQALKYHYKALALYQRYQVPDSSTYNYNALLQAKANATPQDTSIRHGLDGFAYAFACDSDNIAEGDTVPNEKQTTDRNYLPIENEQIINSFNDGKHAIGYGVMLHVKQPVPGKRKQFTKIRQVGHVFVTLIKFNDDCTSSTRTFGFYPKHASFLSATPFKPADKSTFKNDAPHDWDEVVGKLISQQKFERILQLVENYKSRNYHLSDNNCTDFGLGAASIAGIVINNTKGKWPLGEGNNPGDMGESILEGLVKDTDNPTDNLLILNNVRQH